MRNIFLIICTLLIISCEKEKVIEIDKKSNWIAHDEFQYNDIVQMNSHATAERLFILGYFSFTSLVADTLNHPDAYFSGNIARYANRYEQPSNKKMPICDKYFISYNSTNGFLAFLPTKNPLILGTSASLFLKTIDSTYSNFYFINFTSGECIAINNNHQALIPYQSYQNSTLYLKLLLVDIKTTSDGIYDYLDTIKTRTITIKDDYQFDVLALKSIGENFYLSTNSKIYRIDKYGNISNVLNVHLDKIVESSGKLFGFGNNNIYISSNDGVTWVQGYEIQSDFSSLNYKKIDDKLIGYMYGQIFQLSISENDLIVNELDNDGLSGKSITSINKFGDRIYLTSLSGVFYKTTAEFYKEKLPNQ